MSFPPVTPAQRRFAKQLRSSQTALEETLWRELRAKRLNGLKFKRQVPLRGYIVDFVYLAARLIVEADGPLHGEPEQLLHDLRRDEVLRRDGFRVLRFGEERIMGDLAGLVAEIRRALAAGPSPDP